jgi:uncharacterized membrane protein YraQ (UPF0718 family)
MLSLIAVFLFVLLLSIGLLLSIVIALIIGMIFNNFCQENDDQYTVLPGRC